MRDPSEEFSVHLGSHPSSAVGQPAVLKPRSASLRAGSFCMIEAAGSYAGTYYYHFDALGSVVALSDADGDTVQVYEYDVYGQVAASDPNHPNRFLFTGREFDKETGLYYYRARYYNPTIGRFLQTDPIGYADGMGWHGYCGNSPVNFADPTGLWALSYGFLDRDDPSAIDGMLTFAVYNSDGEIVATYGFAAPEDWVDWAMSGNFRFFSQEWKESQPGWDMSAGNDAVFWSIQAVIFLTSEYCPEMASWISDIDDASITVSTEEGAGGSTYSWTEDQIHWDPEGESTRLLYKGDRDWYKAPSLAILAHEIGHAHHAVVTNTFSTQIRLYPDESGTINAVDSETQYAGVFENICRYAFYRKVPGCAEGQANYVAPRPAYGFSARSGRYKRAESHEHPDMSWSEWGDLFRYLKP